MWAGLLHAVGVAGLVAIGTLAYALAAPSAPVGGSGVSGQRPATSGARSRGVHTELAEVEKELAATEARLQEGRRRIPVEPRETEALQELVRLAARDGLRIADYQSAPPIARTRCRQILIHLSGSGDYSSICRFLDSVSRLPRLTTIEALEISASTDASVYPIAVTLAVYFTGPTAVKAQNGGPSNG
jgi:hypothetical protein